MHGLEVGVTGALRLPPLNNDRTVSNHLILDRTSEFQVWTALVGPMSLKDQFGTVRSSEEVLLDVSRGTYILEQITERTGYDLLYRSCRSLIPLLPLLNQPPAE